MNTEPTPSPSERQTIQAFLNVLHWIDADEQFPQQVRQPVNADSAIRWFCSTLHEPRLDSLKGRYAKIANADAALAVLPNYPIFAEKIVIPLLQAKIAFVMGHELACIALAGTVAEMIAILRFESFRHALGPGKLGKQAQIRMFGNAFERVDHAKRIGLLEFAGLIDVQTVEIFSRIRKTRNAFLHRLSESHETLSEVSFQAYKDVCELIQRVLDLKIQNRAIHINSQILAYIQSPPPDELPTEP